MVLLGLQTNDTGDSANVGVSNVAMKLPEQGLCNKWHWHSPDIWVNFDHCTCHLKDHILDWEIPETVASGKVHRQEILRCLASEATFRPQQGVKYMACRADPACRASLCSLLGHQQSPWQILGFFGPAGHGCHQASCFYCSGHCCNPLHPELYLAFKEPYGLDLVWSPKQVWYFWAIESGFLKRLLEHNTVLMILKQQIQQVSNK